MEVTSTSPKIALQLTHSFLLYTFSLKADVGLLPPQEGLSRALTQIIQARLYKCLEAKSLCLMIAVNSGPNMLEHVAVRIQKSVK